MWLLHISLPTNNSGNMFVECIDEQLFILVAGHGSLSVGNYKCVSETKKSKDK